MDIKLFVVFICISKSSVFFCISDRLYEKGPFGIKVQFAITTEEVKNHHPFSVFFFSILNFSLYIDMLCLCSSVM